MVAAPYMSMLIRPKLQAGISLDRAVDESMKEIHAHFLGDSSRPLEALGPVPTSTGLVAEDNQQMAQEIAANICPRKGLRQRWCRTLGSQTI